MRKPLSVTFDDLFGEFFEEMFGNVQSTLGYDALPCNEYMETDQYVLEIAAAGFLKEEISVRITDMTLSITIEKSKDSKTCNASTRKYIAKKIAQRTFRLSKLIPTEYNLDKIECSFRDGLLKTIIPLKKEGCVMNRTIVIN